jgi:AcrR family transcriptional regulator
LILSIFDESFERPPEQGRGSTKDRILESALAEFSECGFAGARVERIALRATANVASIYRYYGNKQDLYFAVLEKVRTAGAAVSDNAPQALGERLQYYARAMTSPRWRQALRLFQWAELDGTSRAAFPDRLPAREVQQIMKAQLAHELSPDLDPNFLYLLETAITSFPQMMPVWTEQIVGLTPQDPEFVERMQSFLRLVAGLLATRPSERTERLADRRDWAASSDGVPG